MERLHERGARAGVYGGDCNSYINDWYTISHVPDDVWVANWYTDQYDPYASVYDLTCLVDDSKWAGRRIRQYAGEFKDTWGGLNMTIDADVVDGEVTAIPLTQMAGVTWNGAAGSAGTGSPNLLSQRSNISSFQPVATGQGWAQVGNQLLWYSASRSWQEITPGHAANSLLLSAFFLDEHQGWAVMRNMDTGKVTLYATSDTGASWRSSAIPAADGLPVASASLDFLNSQTGWLSSQAGFRQQLQPGRPG